MPSNQDLLSRFQEYGVFLRTVARQLVRDPGTVDDVVQETLMRAAARETAGMTTSRSWLATVARNLIRDWFARDRARERHEQEYARRKPGSGRGDIEGVEELLRALSALPDIYRHALHLRFHMQYSFVELADDLGVPVATAKTRVHRALRLLKEDLMHRTGSEAELRSLLAPLLTIPVRNGFIGIGGGMSILGTLMTKKTLVVGVACIAMSGLWWATLGATLPRGALHHSGARDLFARADQASRNLGKAIKESSTKERHRVVYADRSRIRGRVVDKVMKQGVPFCGVQVRCDSIVERLITNKNGEFKSSLLWPSKTTVRVVDLIPNFSDAALVLGRVGDLAPSKAVSHALPGRRQPTMVPIFDGEALDRSMSPSLLRYATIKKDNILYKHVKDAVVQTRPQPLSSFDSPLDIELIVDCGPTYIVRTQLPASASEQHVLVGLAYAPDSSVPDLLQANQHAILQRVPESTDEYWCRFGAVPVPVVDRPLTLHACTTDGFWYAMAAVDYWSGAQARTWSLRWRACGRISGRVTSDQGTPVAERWVQLVGFDHVPLRQSSAKTDRDGRYRMNCVIPGSARVRVAGEDIAPMCDSVHIHAGQVVQHDIVVTRRSVGGDIAGRVVTVSGRQMPRCSVRLMSQNDATLWRRAKITWRRNRGRAVGSFVFKAVPLMACEVRLHMFAPCYAAVRSRVVVPPVRDIEFVVDDTIELRPLRFSVFDRKTKAAVSGCYVHVIGDAGWRTEGVTESNGVAELHVPKGVAYAGARWKVMGSGIGLRHGRVPLDQAAVTVAVKPGYSALLHCFNAGNFHPVADVPCLADGRLLGRTDQHGDLLISLPSTPSKLTLGTRSWRMFGSSELRSSVDPATGLVKRKPEQGQLTLYLVQAGI